MPSLVLTYYPILPFLKEEILSFASWEIFGVDNITITITATITTTAATIIIISYKHNVHFLVSNVSFRIRIYKSHWNGFHKNLYSIS